MSSPQDPHNSGHYTQDGTNVYQFEQHLRAICGWPLREPKLHSPTVMLNLLGEHIPAIQAWHAGLPAEAHLHWYGKAEVQPRRKMAHLNLCAASLDEALEDFRRVESPLSSQENLHPIKTLTCHANFNGMDEAGFYTDTPNFPVLPHFYSAY